MVDALTAIRVDWAVVHLDVMLEQPCAIISECAHIHAATGLSVKLDESAHDVASVIEGYHAGCMQAAALKRSKVGAPSATRHIRDLCLSLGTQMCIEDTRGSDVTTAAVLHLATCTPLPGLMNTCDLSHYVSSRLDASGSFRVAG